MATGAITKSRTLATTFHKPAGEANPYIIILIENWQGINPMGLRADYKKQYFTNMKISPTLLR